MSSRLWFFFAKQGPPVHAVVIECRTRDTRTERSLQLRRDVVVYLPEQRALLVSRPLIDLSAVASVDQSFAKDILDSGVEQSLGRS